MGMMPTMMPMMQMNPAIMQQMQQIQAMMADPKNIPEGYALVPNPMFAQMMQQMQSGGNPMMAMMQGNPMAQMMAGNPMMAGMMSPPQAAGSKASSGAGGAHGGAKAAPESGAKEPIDKEVLELGDYFNIEERWIRRLHETMKKRPETKEEDLAKLYEVLERARSPTGLLTVKIGEMECGQFVGKIKPDADVERLAKKHKLDDHVVSRLTEMAIRRSATKEADLERMDQHLKYCKRPSAMATLLAGKLLEGECEELPDLTEAEAIMTKYKLDEDARSKLREIVEKRPNDSVEVLKSVRKHLESSTYASSMLCKIARSLIDGETLPDPPERKDRPERRERGVDGEKKKKERSRSRDRRDKKSRSRDRDRRKSRSRDRKSRSR